MPSRNLRRKGRSASRQILPLMMAMAILSLSRQALAFRAISATRRAVRPVLTPTGINVEYRLVRTRNCRLFSTPTELSEEQKTELETKIKEKGDEIRVLKEGGADKATVAPLVQELLALKGQLDPSLVAPKKQKPQKQQQQQKQPQNQKQQQQKKQESEESESDFITARSVDYSKWYNDLIRVAGLAETSPVRGCMVIKPWGMSLWDRIRNELDVKIQDHGAENAYFPLLIPKSFLSKEAEHVDGFAKECAVVTHHRLTAGEGGLIADPEAELEDPLIIRPTSETMIWFMFRKWINSYR
jgi:prolyl-tRNA synthetase